ncbi:MAG: NAD-dependent epimerase/dehydratase family protein [Candidatus Omnitrophota bacterium]
MRKKQKKIIALVTGGAGFIGSHLCEELLNRNYRVICIDNLSTGSKNNIKHLLKNTDFLFYKSSILNKKIMVLLIKKCDIIFHMAAAVGVKLIIKDSLNSILTNVEGTANILRLAGKYHKKVILASSSEVYGKHDCLAITEEDDHVIGSTVVNRWSYSASKAIDEFLALGYAKVKKLHVVIIRLFNIVGPRQSDRYGMVLPAFIKQALSNQPITIYGDGSQARSFAYINDAIDGIIELSINKKAEGEIFNLGNNEPIQIKALAEKVKEILASKSKIVFIPYEKAYGANFEDIPCRIPDISKIQACIHYMPRYNLDFIIKNTASYIQKNKK